MPAGVFFMSKILEVLTAPWAIQPTMLQEMRHIYATHLRGDKIDIPSVEAAIGRPLDNKQSNYEVIDGVAVVQINGVIAKRMNMFQKISGGASTEVLAADLRAALDDPKVRSIILHIDSPGGSVDGTQALANVVRDARSEKRIVALADGVMASAAYWIGSAAERVYIADQTTEVGSIGVVAAHQDVSKADLKAGIKVTEITAGKYKRIHSQHEPLSDAGRASIQDQVDYIYSVFVADVAMNRGVSESEVLKNMADGRLFIGQQAIDAGLVDGVATLEALIADLSEGNGAGGALLFASNKNNGNGETEMEISREMILAEAPDLAEEFRAEGHAEGLAAGLEEGRKAGADGERARIKAVESQSVPGHEALIEALKFDGETTGEQAAVAVLGAVNNARKNDAVEAAAEFAAAPETDAAEESNEGLSAEEVARAAWDKDEGLRAEFGGKFERYLAYSNAAASGQVRVLGQKK